MKLLALAVSFVFVLMTVFGRVDQSLACSSNELFRKVGLTQMPHSDVRIVHEIFWRENPQDTPLPLAAGSGLLHTPAGLWIVADDLHHLVYLPHQASIGLGVRIFPGDLPTEKEAAEKVKPDSEALIDLLPGAQSRQMVVFPSGSKKHRTKGKLVVLNAAGQVDRQTDLDFSTLLHSLDRQIPDLNIEGGLVLGDQMILMQRGNGKSGLNGLIKMNLAAFRAGLRSGWDMKALNPRFTSVQLGEWSKVPLTFTDGFVHQNRIYYSAAAEGGKSTYLDGQILGSSLGSIDEHGNATELVRIPDLKIEGAALASDLGNSLEIFAVTDAEFTGSTVAAIKNRLAPLRSWTSFQLFELCKILA